MRRVSPIILGALRGMVLLGCALLLAGCGNAASSSLVPPGSAAPSVTDIGSPSGVASPSPSVPSPSVPAMAPPSASPTRPAETPSPAEVSAAKDTIARYTAALVRGDYPAAWAMLAPEAQSPWGSLASFTYERSAFFKGVAGRYMIDVRPTNIEPITFWVAATYGASIDLRVAVLIEVNYPRLAGNNAGWSVYIVSPRVTGGLEIFDVR